MIRLAILLLATSTATAAPWTKCMKARPYRLVEAGEETIVSGEYYGGGDLGDGVTRPHSAVYVARYDARGGLLWAYAVEGRVEILDQVVDRDGSIYLVGTSYEATDFGAGSTPLQSDYQDAWLASLSNDGKLRWVKRIGKGGSYNQLAELALTADGVTVKRTGDKIANLHFTRDGNAAPYVAAAPGPALVRTSEGEAPHVVKLAFADGTHHWKTSFDDSGRGLDGASALDARNNAFVAGSFQYDLELGGQRLETPHTAAFVASYDPTGALRWMTKLGGGAADDNLWIDELGFDRHGDVLIGGPFYGKLPSATPLPNLPVLADAIGDRDGGFIAKLSGDGNVKWTRSLPARVRKLLVGDHTTVVFGHGAGPDPQCIAHDLPLPE